MRTQLISYLDAGGSVYFEGNDIGYNNKSYDIWPYTGLTYVGDGAAATTGNVQNLTGLLMCSGVTFDYPWKSEADGYVDDFAPNGGEIIFESQDGKGRVGCYTGPSGEYRTITSSVFFSVLEETGTSRAELMSIYRDFMTGGTGVSSQSIAQIRPVELSVPTPVTGSFSAVISAPAGTDCDLNIFDLTGRRTGTLFQGSTSADSNTFSVSAAGLAPGTYLISGRIGEHRVSACTVLLRQ